MTKDMRDENDCKCGDGEGHFKSCPLWLYGSKKIVEGKEEVRTVDPYHLKIIESHEDLIFKLKKSNDALLEACKEALIIYDNADEMTAEQRVSIYKSVRQAIANASQDESK